MVRRKAQTRVRASRDARRSAFQQSVFPGVISPLREVPTSIARPAYVPGSITLPRVQLPQEERIARMRAAGICAREVMLTVAQAVKPGITTDSLDAIVHQATIDRGAYPSPLQYRGFPKSVCTSVNEVICHGIPDSRILMEGDLVNIDITVYLNGFHGDHNATYFVGEVSQESKDLVRVTKECMWLGIAEVKPGGSTREIGRAIQKHADAHGYSSVRDYTGHGIGEEFHTSPTILHYDTPHNNDTMIPGMTFTIEPMITMGDWRSNIWDDEWTVVTRDFSRTAQFEHTLLVTDTGVDVLTLLPDEPREFPAS